MFMRVFTTASSPMVCVCVNERTQQPVIIKKGKKLEKKTKKQYFVQFLIKLMLTSYEDEIACCSYTCAHTHTHT